MRQLEKKPRHGIAFLIAYVLVFSALFILTLLYPREELHIWVNNLHSPFLDELMRYWTYLGDGLVLVIIILFALLVSFRHFLILLSSYAVSGIDTQILKRLFFEDMARPVKYFEIHEIDYELYLVPGIRQLSWHSFPSGHSAAAFAVFIALALFSRSKAIQLLCFMLALGVAFSRMYLSQHFLMDVVAGSALGVAGGWVSWYWLNMYTAEWLDRPAIRRAK